MAGTSSVWPQGCKRSHRTKLQYLILIWLTTEHASKQPDGYTSKAEKFLGNKCSVLFVKTTTVYSKLLDLLLFVWKQFENLVENWLGLYFKVDTEDALFKML